ncbi:MAG: SPOR domain-containing protein [Tepidisphaeraceae bacterium]
MGEGATPPLLFIATLLLVAIAAPGCSNKAAETELSAGFQSLEQKHYDRAIAQADAFLAKEPTGAGSAEALYLRGRAFEGKTAANPHEAKANLQSARSSYVEALNRKPPTQLEARIRSSLANVAYFQDDYATALTQWQAALPRMENADTRAWTIYRIGLCQQRLGQFEQADQTFAAVQKQQPGTEPARRAAQHAGARSFFVQLATFKSAANADQASAALRREGVEPVREANAQGFQLLRVGPVKSYAQAVSLKTKYADRYPDAIILP